MKKCELCKENSAGCDGSCKVNWDLLKEQFNEQPIEFIPQSVQGWICPACGCGNAPWASSCGRCIPNDWNRITCQMS